MKEATAVQHHGNSGNVGGIVELSSNAPCQNIALMKNSTLQWIVNGNPTFAEALTWKLCTILINKIEYI